MVDVQNPKYHRYLDGGQVMNRNKIAERIAEEMLDMEILDLQNYSGDEAAIMEDVQDIILKHLKDYHIVSGEIL